MGLEDEVRKIVNVLKNTKKLTVLTGAGISAESGIPTYRGSGGIWNKFRAEDLAAPEAFARDPELIWKWYGERQQDALRCEPNPAHFVMAEMEKYFPMFILITQNIDNLHQRAGNSNILELHGNLFKARCIGEKCPTAGAPFEFVLGDNPLPRCRKCNELLRPHIVWFGEALDHDVLKQSFDKSVSCDTFMVIGTSAQVQPAASLPLYASTSGAVLIEVNLEKTSITPHSDISIQGKAGKILQKIWIEMEEIN
jgi:NAD-dependent deacetylase